MYHKIDFSHERNLTVDELVRRMQAYDKEVDVEFFRKAFHYAEKAHEGQKRSSV